MLTALSRAPLSIGVLLGLATACGQARQGATATAPEPKPRPGTTVTAEDIERNPGGPIEKHLMGRFPGVLVARTPDGGISVRIRGAASFYSSSEPLYVLDGIPIQAGPGGSLTGINPYDIESIEVLKDPADTALYGVRGANGVIVIKTKRPGG